MYRAKCCKLIYIDTVNEMNSASVVERERLQDWKSVP